MDSLYPFGLLPPPGLAGPRRSQPCGLVWLGSSPFFHVQIKLAMLMHWFGVVLRKYLFFTAVNQCVLIWYEITIIQLSFVYVIAIERNL